VDLGDSVLEAGTLDVFGDLAIPECSFESDKLILLSTGEPRSRRDSRRDIQT